MSIPGRTAETAADNQGVAMNGPAHESDYRPTVTAGQTLGSLPGTGIEVIRPATEACVRNTSCSISTAR